MSNDVHRGSEQHPADEPPKSNEITVEDFNPDIGERALGPKTALRWGFGMVGVILVFANWGLGAWASITGHWATLDWARSNMVLVTLVAVLAEVYAFGLGTRALALARRLLGP